MIFTIITIIIKLKYKLANTIICIKNQNTNMSNYEECVVCLEVCINSNINTDPKANSKCWFLHKSHNKCNNCISLSNAYKCKCSAIAHNNCLVKILKCPTCRRPIDKFNLKINLNKITNTKIDVFLLNNHPLYYRKYIVPLKKENKKIKKELTDTMRNVMYFICKTNYSLCLCYLIIIGALLMAINGELSGSNQIDNKFTKFKKNNIYDFCKTNSSQLGYINNIANFSFLANIYLLAGFMLPFCTLIFIIILRKFYINMLLLLCYIYICTHYIIYTKV